MGVTFLITAGERVQVTQRKATPRRAQNAKPCNAIHGVQQGAGEGSEVPHLLPVAKLLYLNRAERNL